MNQESISPEFIKGLVEAEETYRHLVEGIPAIVYVDAVDEISTNLYTSPQVEALTGYTPEEWSGQPDLFFRALHPEDRERTIALNDSSNATGEPFRAEYRLVARDGSVRWFRDEAVIVRDGSGAPLFWRGIMLHITEQKQAEEKLHRSLEILRRTMGERRMLLYRLEEAQEEERRRIAVDIHDDPIQVLSAADVRLQLLAEGSAGTEMGRAVEDIHRTMTDAIERLRNLLFRLRPPSLDREGLAVAVRTYLRHASVAADLAFAVEDRLTAEPPEEMRATLFRIVQEALTNVHKHAGATRVDVLLESAEGGVRIRVRDDGQGFDPGSIGQPEPGHMGLSALAERAELAGGWWRIDSKPGDGTSVECWLPLHEAAIGGPSGGRAERAG